MRIVLGNLSLVIALLNAWGIYRTWHYLVVGILSAVIGVCFCLALMRNLLPKYILCSAFVLLLYTFVILCNTNDSILSTIFAPILSLKNILSLPQPFGNYGSTLLPVFMLFSATSFVFVRFIQNRFVLSVIAIIPVVLPLTISANPITFANFSVPIFLVITLFYLGKTRIKPIISVILVFIAISLSSQITLGQFANLHQDPKVQIPPMITPFDEYRAYFNTEKFNAELFEIKRENSGTSNDIVNEYARFAVLKNYDSERFTPNLDYIHFTFAPNSGETKTANVTLLNWHSNWLPTLGTPVALQYDDFSAQKNQLITFRSIADNSLFLQDNEDLRCTPNCANTPYHNYTLKYTLTYAPIPFANSDSSKIANLRQNVQKMLYFSYLSRSLAMSESDASSENSWLPNADYAFEPSFAGVSAAQISKVLEQTEAPPPAGCNLADATSACGIIPGDEELFTAVAWQMAKDIGLDARVVVGAKIPPDGIVRGKNVTAWLEVRDSSEPDWKARQNTWTPLEITPRTDNHLPESALRKMAIPVMTDTFRILTQKTESNDLKAQSGATIPEANNEEILGSQSSNWGYLGRAAEVFGVVGLLSAVIVIPIYCKKRKYQKRRKSGDIFETWAEYLKVQKKRYKRKFAKDMTRSKITAFDAAEIQELAFWADAVQYGKQRCSYVDVERFWRAVEKLTRPS